MRFSTCQRASPAERAHQTRRVSAVWWGVFGALQVHAPAAVASNSLMLTITAEAVSQPCSLRPGDETLAVDMGAIVSKTLRRDGRTPSKAFALHLEACDLTMANRVKVTLAGKGAGGNNSLLALSQESTASGMAIGFEHQGQPLLLNQASRAITLTAGSQVLEIGAYVALLPAGQHNLVTGAFNATAQFTLDYD